MENTFNFVFEFIYFTKQGQPIIVLYESNNTFNGIKQNYVARCGAIHGIIDLISILHIVMKGYKNNLCAGEVSKLCSVDLLGF
jgi:hypothetical protein